MCIAQLIIYKLPPMQLTEANTLTHTNRDKHGSTGTHKVQKHISDTIETDFTTPATAAAARLSDTNLPSKDNHEAYNVVCSLDPFENSETITIPDRGIHETQGLVLAPCIIFYKNKVCIIAVQPGTSP